MRALVSLLAALVVSLPVAALANGRFPTASQIVFAPGDPRTVLARATFGMLVSHDGGASFDWVCESAVGYQGIEDPFVGMTAGGSVVVGLLEGLSVSPDGGCAWSAPGGPLAAPIVDVVVRPDTPHVALVLASTPSPTDGGTDEGLRFASQIHQSTDDGAHWAPLGAALDPAWQPETVDATRSDPHRLYVSAVHGTGASRTAALLVSADDGATWTERPIPLDASSETAAYIAGIDPLDADRVYVRTDGRSRLLVTTDAGRTFSTVVTLSGPMLGFALAPDGSRVYVGSKEDGLLAASSGDLAFAHRSAIAVRCLAARSGELWACSDEASGFFLGASTDDGATFRPVLHLDGVSGPLACPSGAAGATCAASFSGLCDQLGGCAGQPSTTGAAETPSSSRDGCACDVARSRARATEACAALACMLVLGVARRFGRSRPLACRQRGRSRRRSRTRTSGGQLPIQIAPCATPPLGG